MKPLRFYLAAAIAVVMAVLLLNPAAFAQAVAPASGVSIPVNDWLAALASVGGPILAAVVVWLIRKLPAQVASLLMAMRVDQLLMKAITFAINSVKDATHDKPLTIDLGNDVVEKALQYAIDHGPAGLIHWMGGADMIREKIIARLNIEAKAAVK